MEENILNISVAQIRDEFFTGPQPDEQVEPQPDPVEKQTTAVDPAVEMQTDPVDPVAPADPVVPVDPVQECEPQPSVSVFRDKTETTNNQQKEKY